MSGGMLGFLFIDFLPVMAPVPLISIIVVPKKQLC